MKTVNIVVLISLAAWLGFINGRQIKLESAIKRYDARATEQAATISRINYAGELQARGGLALIAEIESMRREIEQLKKTGHSL